MIWPFSTRSFASTRRLRLLLLAPALVLLLSLALAFLLGPAAPVPTVVNTVIMIATLVLHGVLWIGGAICTGLYARRVRFEVAKWVVAAVFFPYVAPAILYFMRVSDPWVDEFGELFQEFCFAETERIIALGQKPDAAAVARAAVERSAAVLTHRYRISPADVARVAESFLRTT